MPEQTVSFIKGRHGDIAVHDWGNDQPRYLALLVHGYGEHLGRYQYVARTLQAQGARVFGPDHLGHGLSQGVALLARELDVDEHPLHVRRHRPAPTRGPDPAGGGRVRLREAQLRCARLHGCLRRLSHPFGGGGAEAGGDELSVQRGRRATRFVRA